MEDEGEYVFAPDAYTITLSAKVHVIGELFKEIIAVVFLSFVLLTNVLLHPQNCCFKTFLLDLLSGITLSGIGIKASKTTYNANALPTALSLQPLKTDIF